MTVAVIDVPHDPSDQELLTWWQDSGNRWAGVMSGMLALLVAVTIPVVMNYLQRLDAATRSPQWLSFARSMGVPPPRSGWSPVPPEAPSDTSSTR